jgi:hypothetical protein
LDCGGDRLETRRLSIVAPQQAVRTKRRRKPSQLRRDSPIYSLRRTNQLGCSQQINMDQPNTHHDALELPDGHFALVNDLSEGQLVTVLQLPATPRAVNSEHRQASSLVA